MSDGSGRKTEQAHWDAAWHSPVRPRAPSRLNVDVRNLTDLLRRHVKAGERYVEVGCAPGKLLAWVAMRCQAKVSGLDYSATGIAHCRGLVDALGLDVQLHQGDFFAGALPERSFDVVTSFGFIEHFDDPTDAVRRHLDLLAPGGVAIITVPHYGGLYGRLQARCDPANLALHNTAIMNPRALAALVDPAFPGEVKAYASGRASPWLVSLGHRMPAALARGVQWSVNLLAHLQPWTIDKLAPMLVLEVHRARTP